MLISLKWLRDYVDIKESDFDLASKVNDTGSHVDAFEIRDNKISGKIVVAEILDIIENDGLKNTRILNLNIGNDKIQVLTAAKNIVEGDRVLVALEGTVLPDNKKIESKKIGNFMSNGMLVSYEELGFSDSVVPKNSKGGVAIISDDIEVGTSYIDALELDSPVVDFEITPNRPDCLSVLGMARETGASYLTNVKYPQINFSTDASCCYSELLSKINIQTEYTKRFVTRILKDVVVKESPQWIKNRLMALGVRPINNIVDITNYVMLEYGQPMHAYDLEKIKGNLVVRNAHNNEEIITLDGEKRILSSDDLVIADDSGAIGIAGVIGGLSTEVSESTRFILLECGNFDSEKTRQTAKRLGLRTEASYRFSKGVSVDLTLKASDRFCSIIETLNIGKICEGISDIGKYSDLSNLQKTIISVNKNNLNKLLGTNLSIDDIVMYLKALELNLSVLGDDILVQKPIFRDDLELECDLIEEVGRLYGISNIKPQPLNGVITRGLETDIHLFAEELRDFFVSVGLMEILTYSFESPKNDEKLLLNNSKHVKIENPLGEEFSVMRNSLIPSMLDVLSYNLKVANKDLRLFEVSKVFKPKDLNARITEELVDEKMNAIIAMSQEYDFYYLKNILLELFSKFNIDEYNFVTVEDNSTFHSGRCAKIVTNLGVLGYIGEVHPSVLNNYEINEKIILCEIDVNLLMTLKKDVTTFKLFSRFPSMKRDLSLLVDEDIQCLDIEKVIISSAGEYLSELELFDIYRGNQIPQNKKSISYRLLFSSVDRTLKEKEVSEAFNNVLETLEKEYRIKLREE